MSKKLKRPEQRRPEVRNYPILVEDKSMKVCIQDWFLGYCKPENFTYITLFFNKHVMEILETKYNSSLLFLKFDSETRIRYINSLNDSEGISNCFVLGFPSLYYTFINDLQILKFLQDKVEKDLLTLDQ